jgi:hypothetical protein
MDDTTTQAMTPAQMNAMLAKLDAVASALVGFTAAMHLNTDAVNALLQALLEQPEQVPQGKVVKFLDGTSMELPPDA